MSIDRSDDRSGDRWGLRSWGLTRLVALAALAALLAGASLVFVWGDQGDADWETPEAPPAAATDTEAAGEPEPSSPRGAADVGIATKVRAPSTVQDRPESPATSSSLATVKTEPPAVSIAAGSRLVTESGPVVFTLTRTGETEAELTVAVGVAESGSVLDGAAPETVMVTFSAGEPTASLSVVLEDDSVVEVTSRVTATIAPGPGYTIHAHADAASVYVTDNDRIFLLPDLVSDPPVQRGEAQVVTWAGEEMLVLRFEGYVTNLGDGPLHLSGDPQLADPDDPTSHDVWQRVLTSTGDWVSLTKPPVRYETTDGHNHFHLMEIVAYSLWDEAGETQVAPGEKVGFCMLDVERLPERHAAPNERAYDVTVVDNCRANEPEADSLQMGVTEGWRDVYEAAVPFQWVDVSNLSPGNYRLAAEADPHDILVESDETNNGVALSHAISVVPGYVAQPLEVVTESDTAIDIVLAATTFGSPGARVFRIVTAPASGTLNAATGVVLWGTVLWYTPNEGFSGVDTFEYKAFDFHSAYPRTDPEAMVTIRVGEASGATPTPDQQEASGEVTASTEAGANTAPVVADP